MEALKRAGIPVEMLELGKDIQIDEIQSVQLYGLYPFSFREILLFLRQKGIKIVYDLDDPMDFVDDTNPFLTSVARDSWSFKEILPFVDEVTVSTPRMADYIKNYRTDVKVTIVPNTFDQQDWLFMRPKRDGIRIGFAGGAPHVASLLQVLPAIKNLQKRYDIRFLIFGLGQGMYTDFIQQFKGLAVGRAQKLITDLEEQLKDLKFEWTPFIDYEVYFPTLINMAFDIGLCPLEDTLFNKHRSASKAMEYTLSGALAIASDVEAFRNDPTSILVKDNKWEETIEKYILDRGALEVSRRAAVHWITENRNVDNQVDLLKSIYVV